MALSYSYDVYPGLATVTASTVSFTQGLCNFLTVEFREVNRNVIVNLSYDGVNFGGDIYIMSIHGPRTLPFACRALRVRRWGANDALFNIVPFF